MDFYKNFSHTLNQTQNFVNIKEDLDATLDASEDDFEILEMDIDGNILSKSFSTDDLIIEEIFEDDKSEENCSEFTKIKNFTCLLCSLNFTSKFNLERHFDSVRHRTCENEFIALEQGNLTFDDIIEEVPDDLDVPKYELYVCKDCYTTFGRLNDYKKHLKTHSIHKCEKCSRTFKTEQDFKIHMTRHQNSQEFICEICNKKFTNNQNLRRHQKAHNGLKKFECKICDHKFGQKSNLLRHMKIH